MDWITLYVLLFSGYYFNPCSGTVCLSIEGHNIPARQEVCKDRDCVREFLKDYPRNHLDRIIKVEIMGSHTTITEMDVVSSHDIKERAK